MSYFKQILLYALPYKTYGILNIICNFLYALFSTLAMVSLFPMINVLFDSTKRIISSPQWTGLSNLKDYGEQYLGYYVTQKESEGDGNSLLYMVLIIIISQLMSIF